MEWLNASRFTRLSILLSVVMMVLIVMAQPLQLWPSAFKISMGALLTWMI